MTTADRLFILDDAGHTTEIRRPGYARRVSSQAGLASFRPLLDRIGPGAADQMEREVALLAAAGTARMGASEEVVAAAVAFIRDYQAHPDDHVSLDRLEAAVRTYQEETP